MEIERRIAHAPRVAELARACAALTGPCIGCTGCKGLCAALIEVVALPEIILKRDG